MTMITKSFPTTMSSFPTRVTRVVYMLVEYTEASIYRHTMSVFKIGRCFQQLGVLQARDYSVKNRDCIVSKYVVLYLSDVGTFAQWLKAHSLLKMITSAPSPLEFVHHNTHDRVAGLCCCAT